MSTATATGVAMPVWLRVLLGAIAAGLVAIVALLATVDPVQPRTCDELLDDMLAMTGPTATEAYDLDRVRELNRELDGQACR